MNCDFEHIPNPDYDLKKPIGENGNFPDMINPLCAAAKLFCVEFTLPLLENGFAPHQHKISSKDLYNEALRQIATHQVAPPPWLAQMILDKTPLKKARLNGLKFDEAEAIFNARINNKEMLTTWDQDDCNAEDRTRAETRRHDRLVELWEEYKKHFEATIDNLP